MKDLNPAPRLKNPDRVTKHMVTNACVVRNIHAPVRMRNPFKGWKKRGEKEWLVGSDTTHDICTNVNRAIRLAVCAGMPIHLSGPHGPYAADKPGSKIKWWEVDIPPAKGRLYRRFRAKTPAKAICAALLDFLDHPAV